MTVASTASSTQQVHLTVERRSKSRYPLAWPCRHKNYNRIWLVETCLPPRAANSFIILLSWAVLFFSCRIHIYFLLLFVFVSIFISTYCGHPLVVLRVEEFVETSVTNIYISYRYLNLYLRLCLSLIRSDFDCGCSLSESFFTHCVLCYWICKMQVCSGVDISRAFHHFFPGFGATL